ncbi:MAG: MAPEG family protein [Gammaproteobacteria bacterium]|nr:MAPEG family protein [Gammaproteobacteria bacterium]
MRISMITAGLLGLLLIALSAYVIAGRVKFKIDLGDGDNPAMIQRIRAQANFVEYVPLALILLMLVEYASIGPRWLTMAMGGALVAGRVLHAQGLIASSGATAGRFIGTNLTALVIVSGSIALLGRGAGFW